MKKYTKVKCLLCNALLISTYRHDFQMCACPNQAFADGGYDYSRVGAKELNMIMVWDYELDDWRKCGREE